MNVTEMVSNVYFEIQLPTVIGLCLQFKPNVIEILCNVQKLLSFFRLQKVVQCFYTYPTPTSAAFTFF